MLHFSTLDTSSLRSGVSKLRRACQMRPAKRFIRPVQPSCQWWKI